MLCLILSLVFYSYVCFGQLQKISFIQETIATESVRTDPDDPAIWIHPHRSELSLIIGTDKADSIGGLYVYDLNGKIIQSITNIDRPNNVDVEYGFRFNETYSIDLIVLTERGQSRLRIFSINIPTRRLYEITGQNTVVFTDSVDREAAPMGIGLYKRVTDGKIYAIVSRKSGPRHGYLGQYELVSNGPFIDVRFTRYFGDFQGEEIESIVVDDQLGYVYYSDEKYGIRKYHADPTTHQTEQIGFINTTQFWLGDSEGLALYQTSEKNGYLIMTDQLINGSIFHIYERQGKNSYIKSIQSRADKTDGIEATSHYLNDKFPRGLLIVMNEIGKNFLIYDWRNIENELGSVNNHVDYNRLDVFCIILELCIIFFRSSCW